MTDTRIVTTAYRYKPPLKKRKAGRAARAGDRAEAGQGRRSRTAT